MHVWRVDEVQHVGAIVLAHDIDSRSVLNEHTGESFASSRDCRWILSPKLLGCAVGAPCVNSEPSDALACAGRSETHLGAYGDASCAFNWLGSRLPRLIELRSGIGCKSALLNQAGTRQRVAQYPEEIHDVAV